jgi:hypothetical protein
MKSYALYFRDGAGNERRYGREQWSEAIQLEGESVLPEDARQAAEREAYAVNARVPGSGVYVGRLDRRQAE